MKLELIVRHKRPGFNLGPPGKNSVAAAQMVQVRKKTGTALRRAVACFHFRDEKDVVTSNALFIAPEARGGDQQKRMTAPPSGF